MTKKRILKYSCLTLSVICGLFICTCAIFAAAQNSISCTTKVNYDPSIKAVVEVKVNDGQNASYQTVFNNTGNTFSSASTYFYLTTPPSNSNNLLYSSSSVQFRVTNYTTDKSITATVRLANSSQDKGVTIPANVDLYDSSNVQLSYTENSTTYSNATKINNKVTGTVTNDYISAYANSTASSASSTEFYVQTLFSNTIVPFIITLTTNS